MYVVIGQTLVLFIAYKTTMTYTLSHYGVSIITNIKLNTLNLHST